MLKYIIECKRKNIVLNPKDQNPIGLEQIKGTFYLKDNLTTIRLELFLDILKYCSNLTLAIFSDKGSITCFEKR